MAVNAGRDVLIKVDTADTGGGTATWVTIAQQRGGSFSRTTELADATHKDDNGWQSSIGTTLGWSLSVDGALDPNDPAIAHLRTQYDAKAKVWVQFDASAITGGQKKEGQAWIANYTEEAPVGDVLGFTLELTGDGALVTSP